MANKTHRTLEEIRASSDAEHRHNAQTVAGIKGDANLSQQGKRNQLAAEQQRHKAAMASLRTERDEAQAAKQDDALHSLFGATYSYGMDAAERRASVVSMRDALQRAVGMDEQQMTKAYQLALVVGDEDMRKAIALAAYSAGNIPLAETWAKEDTGRLEKFQQLVEISAPPSATQKLADRMNYSASPAPRELGHIGANAQTPSAPESYSFGASGSNRSTGAPDSGNGGNGQSSGNAR